MRKPINSDDSFMCESHIHLVHYNLKTRTHTAVILENFHLENFEENCMVENKEET